MWSELPCGGRAGPLYASTTSTQRTGGPVTWSPVWDSPHKLVENWARKVYTVIISCDGFHCPSMLTLQPSNRGWMASHGAARLADGKMLNSNRNGVGELLWLTGRAHTVPETKTLRWRPRPKIRLSLSYSFKNLFLLFPVVQLGINELADWTS